MFPVTSLCGYFCSRFKINYSLHTGDVPCKPREVGKGSTRLVVTSCLMNNDRLPAWSESIAWDKETGHQVAVALSHEQQH